MQSRYWKVPTVKLARQEIPSLFLGDRAFLKRYGSDLSPSDVENLMSYACDKASIGLSVSDYSTIKAAIEVRNRFELTVLLHLQSMIGANIDQFPYRVGATLRQRFWLDQKQTKECYDRSILNYFEGVRSFPILTRKEISELKINRTKLKEALQMISMCDPKIVTLGGDWLDLCILFERDDLIKEVFENIRSVLSRTAQVFILSFFITGVCRSRAMPIMRMADGLASPNNLIGDGMFPSKGSALDWISKQPKPHIAINVLSMGRIPVYPALDYIYNHQNVPCAIVGVSRKEHIDELIFAGERVLSENRR